MGKAAIFQGSGQSIDVLLTEDLCVVPHEVLQIPLGHLKIGVYGTGDQGQRVTPTVWADAGEILEGTQPAGIEETPATESLAQQLLEAVQSAKEIAQSVRTRTPAFLTAKRETPVRQARRGRRETRATPVRPARKGRRATQVPLAQVQI